MSGTTSWEGGGRGSCPFPFPLLSSDTSPHLTHPHPHTSYSDPQDFLICTTIRGTYWDPHCCTRCRISSAGPTRSARATRSGCYPHCVRGRWFLAVCTWQPPPRRRISAPSACGMPRSQPGSHTEPGYVKSADCPTQSAAAAREHPAPRIWINFTLLCA